MVDLVLLGRAQLLSSCSFQGDGEMAFRAICIALLLASLPSAGCGTVANLANSHPEEGGTTPFGGVKKDVSCLKNAVNKESGCKPLPRSDSEQYRQVALGLFCAADLPLSAIGDVVTWPYTATYTYINQPTPTTPVTLAPTYPVMQAPTPPATPATPGSGPQTSPLELLPEPKKLP
jgi:hypothetical protein